AELIANESRQSVQQGLTHPRDYASLARTRAAMAPFEVMLLVHGVPARIQGSSPFFHTTPVRRIMAYIRLGTGRAPETVLRDDFRRAVRDRGIIASNAQLDGVWESCGAAANPQDV